MSSRPVEVIEIRDETVDVDTLMALIRDRATQRRNLADPAPDLDATTRLVFAEAGATPAAEIDASLAAPAPIAAPLDQEILPALRDLNAQWMIREQPFTSNTPLIGPLIVKVRDAWNWMSTKWYVRPILWQQSEVNVRTSHVISDLAQWHELDARRVSRLESRLAELEARLARIESSSEPTVQTEDKL